MNRVFYAVCLFTLFIGLSILPGSGFHIERVASYTGPANASAELTTPHPVLSTLRVRQAIAFCTDREALVAAAYPEINNPTQRQALIIDSFLPKDHWGYKSPDQQYPYNPEQGKALLEAAGWSLPIEGAPREGANGEILAIRLYIARSALSEQYISTFESQMSYCGIMVNIAEVDPIWLFGSHNGLQHRDFELGIFSRTDSDDPVMDLPGLYGCDSIPSLENNWTGQNFSGWCNAAASAALEQAVDSQLSQAERASLLAIAQDAFASDLPSLPLFRSNDNPNAWEHLDFNLHKVLPVTRPLSDIRVRRAIANCTDKAALVRAGYGPALSEQAANGLVIDTFLPKSHWLYSAPEVTYPYDPVLGQQLLSESGWVLLPGTDYRTNAADEELTIKLTTTTASFRRTWAEEFESQMAACGIRIIRQHFSAAWWFGDRNGLQVRDFEMGGFAWVSSSDPGGATLWDCNQIPSPENNWSGQNYMAWCNQLASRSIRRGVNTINRSMRQYYYDVVQQEYARDIPALPLFNRIEFAATAADLQGLAPTPGESYYTYNIYQWRRPGRNPLVLGFTQEPGLLYPLVDNSIATQLVAQLVVPPAYTSLNYDFQPYWMRQLSTLENGLARNEIVSVHEGDKIMNSDGDIVSLEPGVVVMDSAGNEVEFQGGMIQMRQLIVRYEARDDLRWQDGSSVTQADLELGYKTACDIESGASTFINCHKTKEIHFAGRTYTVTWLPGVQDPLYFLAPYGIYPSRQPILSPGLYQGKTLADVPAKDWPSLPEVTEKPWSYGPYMVEEWIHGDRIEFQANPYFFKGTPSTPNIVIKFISAGQATSSLIDGVIDVLGWESLSSLSDDLTTAEQNGIVKIHITASGTWEHIDFNLDPLPVAVPVAPGGQAQIPFTDPQGDVLSITVPSGAVETPVELLFTYQPVTNHPLPPGQVPAGLTYTLTAYQNDQPLNSFFFLRPLTITFDYSNSDVLGLVEEELVLNYWDGIQWADAAGTCTGADYNLERDPDNNTMHMNICQTGEFNLVGIEEVHYINLPVIRR